MTSAPSSCSSLTVARPIPEAPPVTSAILLCTRPNCSPLAITSAASDRLRSQAHQLAHNGVDAAMFEKKFGRKRHAKIPGDRFRNHHRINGIQSVFVKTFRRIEGVRLHPKLLRKRSYDSLAKAGL